MMTQAALDERELVSCSKIFTSLLGQWVACPVSVINGAHTTAITIAMYDTCQPSLAHTNLSWHSVKTYKVYILWFKQQRLNYTHNGLLL